MTITMMKTIRISIYLLSLSFLTTITSCDSEKDDYIYLSDELRLSVSQNENEIELNWTLTKFDNFREYIIYRSNNKDDYNSSNSYYNGNAEMIFSTEDYFLQKFTDKAPNALGTNYYWILAYDNSGYYETQVIKSNLDSINISQHTSFNSFPIGTIFNADENLVGFIDNTSTFTLYNYDILITYRNPKSRV